MDNTTHILQHTIIHYPYFPHSIILKLHHFCCPKTHLHLIFYFSYKISLLRKQHNSWHNTNNLMYLLYLTFILSISHFHIFYKHIPHKIPTHTSHISLNSMSHKVYIYKIHVQHSIYIQFLYIFQTPYLKKYIYSLPSPHILKRIKHSFKNTLQKSFLMEGI